MDEMIKINVRVEHETMVTDSKNVAEVFGKRHDNVLRDIEGLKKDLLNFEEMFYEATMPDSYGRPQKVYMMNRDGFSILVMGFTGSEALKWKTKYIEAFNKLEKAWNTPELVIARGLQASQKLLAETQERLKLLEADNEVMKPKALFADSVAASDNTILIGELAKIIKANGVDIGQNRLFAWLRDRRYLIQRKGTDYNMPTQKAMELGLFKIKETTINKPDGSVAISKTVKVTGKGQQYFINKFLGEAS